MMVSGNIFYASDKAVFDALTQKKITNEQLAELFFTRGTIISKKTSRDNLSKYFSRNIHDYYDHQFIAKIFGSTSRKEKTIATRIKNNIDADEIESIVSSLCTNRSDNDEKLDFITKENGYDITIKYKEIDYNKTEFKQVSDKEAIISLIKEGEEWFIRSPLNDFIENIKENLLDNISVEIQNNNGELITENIELITVSDFSLRKKFFDKELISSIGNYSLHDVTHVYVYNPDDESDEEIHISKASLNGNGVLESSELSSLYEKGFYIWKIIWKIRENNMSDIYEIEAQFANAKVCDKFSYLIRGFYKYKDGDYNSSKTQLSNADELRITQLIDKAAKFSMDKIKKEWTNNNGQVN